MRILGRNWEENFLDYALLPGTYRIQVQQWCVLSRLSELYYVPARDWRLVWNYLWEFGFTQVVRKIISRRREGFRNKKCIAFGIGEILECGANTAPLTGQVVAFLAPAHPLCVERIVLPEELVDAVDGGLIDPLRNGLTLCDPCTSIEQRWKPIAGWNQYSGSPLDRNLVTSILDNLVKEIGHCPGRRLTLEPFSPVREFAGAEREPSKAVFRGVIFGLGHYAKTNILPNLDSRIRIARVHEIDPTQLAGKAFPFQLDSSPTLRPGQKANVFFIAGFHHTHASLAMEALRQGALAVVEKPIATTHADLIGLLGLLRLNPGMLFSGFHKRYSEFNEPTLSDLHVSPGGPVSYFCIVHEAPLPRLHWYRWPNSCSRLLSNGCHWIDHFLYLNRFANPVSFDVWESTGEDMNVMIQLENGASFTMTLTDRGSSRIGVEDHVELRSGDATVRITNGCSYVAESSRSVLRRMKVNRANSYSRMYAEISKKIITGEPGDAIDTVECSAKLILDLEANLTAYRASRRAQRFALPANP